MADRACRTRPAGLLVGGVVAALLLFRLWTSFCFFPLAEWNSVRLAATFLLRFGPTPYPWEGDGPVTTWIYGPATLFAFLPATMAASATGALLVAGALNLLIAVVPLALAIQHWPAPSRSDRLAAFLLALACWPNTSLQFIQADNLALGCALVSTLLLRRAPSPGGWNWFGAALLAQGAAWSKQPAVALIFAQLLWIAIAHGRQALVRYAGWHLILAAVLVSLAVLRFGAPGLWLNAVAIPRAVPWVAEIGERARILAPHLAVGVAAPLVAAIAFRRAIWRRDSPWLLPFLSWLFLLPGGIAASFKAGGASNSLAGWLLLLPPSALALSAVLRSRQPAYAASLTATLTVGIVLLQLNTALLTPLRPVTQHLEEGTQLAHAFPRQVYFPWHPLLTWYAERRFDHAEDGLHTRHLAGMPLAAEQVRAHVPPAWSVTAVPGWMEEGRFRTHQPPDATLRAFGRWSIFLWGDAAAAVNGSDLTPGATAGPGARP